jgi:hypothetical protein
MGKASKGSAFERQICGLLSAWWTQDFPEPRDDVFWRTSNSGGRATSRGKQGKDTKHQHGDLTATDPVGEPLCRVLNFELKRGYNRATLSDLLDRPGKAAEQTYEEWIRKAREVQVRAGTLGWLIIHRRDRREALVTGPQELCRDLIGPLARGPIVGLSGFLSVRGQVVGLFQGRLRDFLDLISPRRIWEIAASRKERGL